MDREISKELYEVGNPVYLSFDDMMKKYLGYVVVMTNIDFNDRKGIRGGVVRYYTQTSKEGYLDKWIECGNMPEYGETMFYNFIPRPGSMGGLYL